MTQRTHWPLAAVVLIVLASGCGDDTPDDLSPSPSPMDSIQPETPPTPESTGEPTAPLPTTPPVEPTSTSGVETVPPETPVATPTLWPTTPWPITPVPPTPSVTPFPDEDGDGYTILEGDCLPGDSSVYPGALEIPYDGIDQDCADGDKVDVDEDGFTASQAGGDDCNDEEPSIYPGATEIPYDGIAQDCVSDEVDVDEDGYTAAEVGGDDCDDADSSVHPFAQEIPYDDLDQDCLEGDLVDVDQDGHDALEAGGDDCDDTDANTFPDAEEFADGKDNDCDGLVDDELDTSDDDLDGFSELEGDCNDASSEVYPDAVEVPYDGVDQDCTGLDLTDVDEDGFDSVVVEGGGDCDDDNPDIYPEADEVAYDGIDQDCVAGDLTDFDGDGFDSTRVEGGSDCNDDDPAIYPTALELCDGLDNNCDGVVDTDASDRPTFYTDSDGDGFGSSAHPVLSCEASGSLVANGDDCDDTSSLAYPGADEQCDSRDNDCDGQVDEGVKSTYYIDQDDDGYGNEGVTVQDCSTPSGYVADSTDCNDKNQEVYPGALEKCNGRDDDCDQAIDEGLPTRTWYLDSDGDGYGSSSGAVSSCGLAPDHYVSIAGDCSDEDSSIHPGAAETCDGVDQNCNGATDEGVMSTYYYDGDEDGFGVSSPTVQSCTQPDGYAATPGDCQDADENIHPGASETCNQLDDDCDASADEGVLVTYYVDADGDGYGNSSVTTQACTRPTGYSAVGGDCNDLVASIYPTAMELPNQVDDDCDGQIDDGAIFASCKALLVAMPGTPDGDYSIDPDGASGSGAPFIARCDMTTDGGGWTRFWWVLGTSPTASEDPFGTTLSSCSVSSDKCLGRIPAQVNPADFMVKDVDEKHYAAWHFNSANAISNAILSAFRDHVTACLANQALFAPYRTNDTSGEAWCGNGGEGGCDSFVYTQVANSCVSFRSTTGWVAEFDGDTGCYAAAFKMGAGQTGYSPQCDSPDYNFLDDGPSTTDDMHGELYYR